MITSGSLKFSKTVQRTIHTLCMEIGYHGLQNRGQQVLSKKVSIRKQITSTGLGIKLINLPDIGLCKYKGELDKEGQACGRGEAI